MRDLVNCGYQTWDEFVEKAATRLIKPSLGNKDAIRDGRHSWAGGSFDDALHMARQGWPGGAEAIAQALDSLPPADEVLPDWQLEAAGAFPCIPAYLSGDAECMYRLADERKPERRLTLVVPGVALGDVPAEAMQQYAKAIAAIVRMLEASNVSVAVYRVLYSHGRGMDVIHGHAVREHGEPLDLGKVAFAFHPAMFRRLTFAWWEVDERTAKAGKASDGRGVTAALTDTAVRTCLPDIGQFVIMPDMDGLNTRGLLYAAELPRLIEYMRGWIAGKLEQLT